MLFRSNIADVYKSDEFDFSGPMKYDALTNYRTQSMLVIPLKDNENEVIGVLQLINALDEEGRTIPFDPSYEFIISSLASQAAIAVANMMYVEEMKTLMKSFVQAMATAIDERTPYNGSHTRKVTEYASMIADYMNELYKAGKSEIYFDENRKENLQLAASLHDIGKMIVPLSVMNKSTRLGYKINDVLGRLELICCYMKCDMLEGTLPEAEYKVEKQYIDDCVRFIQDINGLGFLCDEKLRYIHELDKKYYINKKGKKTKYITPQEAECMMIQKGTLTADERFIMESHVSMTAKILDKVHFSRSYEKVPVWASSHHEMMDGSGYPNHLKGDDVELETRILAAVDIYDALTSADRPYKKPMDKDKAFSVLNEMANEGKLDKTIIGYLHSCLQI